MKESFIDETKLLIERSKLISELLLDGLRLKSDQKEDVGLKEMDTRKFNIFDVIEKPK